MTNSPLTIAILGCGSRGRTYARIAAKMPERYRLVAAADPNVVRLDEVEQVAAQSDFRRFESAEELFAAGRLADILIVATQDAQHFPQAMEALRQDYHLLLEKPAAQSMDQVLQLRQLAEERERKVALCFVLRYTPFYRTVREVVQSGRLGEIIHIEATEGVGAFHHVHSFVRGHWSQSANSTPMIIAKCSHDTDIISWLMDQQRVTRVSSFGELTWFKPEHAPEGATARCTDGCPHVGSCHYDAHRYIGDQRRWLEFVYPGKTEDASAEDITAWLATSPWGRCAWKCDNDVVDHQSVAMEFDSGTTATLSMSAFDRGRQLSIHGTEGTLRGGDDWATPGEMRLWFRPHDSEEAEEIPLPAVREEGYAGHGGGDFGLIDSLDEIFTGLTDSASLLEQSLESHLIGFAAEQSRLNHGQPVDLREVRK